MKKQILSITAHLTSLYHRWYQYWQRN